MITLTSKEGVTDIHCEGTHMKPARALMFLTQEHLKQLSKEGDTE